MYIFCVCISSFEKRPDLNSLEWQLCFCEEIKTFCNFFSISIFFSFLYRPMLYGNGSDWVGNLTRAEWIVSKEILCLPRSRELNYLFPGMIIRTHNSNTLYSRNTIVISVECLRNIVVILVYMYRPRVCAKTRTSIVVRRRRSRRPRKNTVHT